MIRLIEVLALVCPTVAFFALLYSCKNVMDA